MLYVVHRDQVACAAFNFTPFQPSRWQRGQIVHFSAACSTPAPDVDYAILVSLSGTSWHMEVLAVTPPIDPSSQAKAGITVRILRRLESDDETLALVSSYASRMTRLSRSIEEFAEHQGAA